MATPDLSRDELLAMTPQRYLAAGWRDGAGRVHAYLGGSCALAACAQLEEAQVSPQELGATLQAFEQVLPYYGADPAPRLSMATQEVLELVAATLGQTTHPGLLAWLQPCILSVRDADDLRAFLLHLRSVVRQYAALMAMRSSAGAPGAGRRV